MASNNEREDFILCLKRLRDHYFAILSLISNTINLEKRGPLKSLSPEQNSDFWRIQFSLLIEQVVLTHCKLLEVKSRYAKQLPENERNRLNQYYTNERVKALQVFRNKCVGHAIDKDTKGPIETKVLQELVVQIFGANNLQKNIVPSFFDTDNPNNPDTLVGIIEDILKVIDETKT